MGVGSLVGSIYYMHSFSILIVLCCRFCEQSGILRAVYGRRIACGQYLLHA